MAGIYDLTLAAGAVPQTIGALGSYLKVLSTPTGPIRIRFDGGEQVQLVEGQGRRFLPGEQFREVQVTNASGSVQRVLVFIGDSTFEDTRVSGDVAVVDSVRSNVQTVGMASVTAITALTNTQLLDPNLNTAGAVIRQCTLEATAGAGGTVNSRVIVAPAAPAGPNGNHLTIGILLVNSTTQQVLGNFDLKKRIPPGWGVWHQTQVTIAVASSNTASLSYELLA